MTIHIGTSGWHYGHWKGRFYPTELAQSRWLEFYAERFSTVEVNNTFYRLPGRETFEAWREQAPPGFTFALKMSRFLSHIKRLREPEEAVERFFEVARGLGEKRGPTLIQLPATMRADHERLDAALRAFPRGERVAVEFRHPSWWSEETRAVLATHNAALCLADRHSRPVTPLWRTADWGYVRFHEGRGRPHPCYGRWALESWAGRIAGLWPRSADVWVYFNNDGLACALADAHTFALAVARHGLEASPTTPARDVRVG